MFGLSPSPFLLNATLKQHLEKYKTCHPNTISHLLDSIYVDDVITGAETEEAAFQLYQQSKKIFGDASFNLRKFCTNSTALQQRIDCIEKHQHPEPPGVTNQVQLDPYETYGESTLGETLRVGPEDQKVLGMCWRPGEDSLAFDVMPIRELANMWEPIKHNVVTCKHCRKIL